MKKITNNTFNKMSNEKLIRLIDKATGTYTVFTRASKRELVSEAIGYYNKGLLTAQDILS